jgi:hypothetical protein
MAAPFLLTLVAVQCAEGARQRNLVGSCDTSAAMCEAESTGGALSLRAVGGESTHFMWLFFMQKATRYVDICLWVFEATSLL